MWRVRAVYCTRCVTHPMVAVVGMLAGAFAIVSSVSVANVVINTQIAASSPLSLLHYFITAFVTTELIVQIASIVIVAFFIFLLYDLHHHIRGANMHHFAHN